MFEHLKISESSLKNEIQLLPDHESAVANRVHHRQADRRRVAGQLRPLRRTEIRLSGEGAS